MANPRYHEDLRRVMWLLSFAAQKVTLGPFSCFLIKQAQPPVHRPIGMIHDASTYKLSHTSSSACQ